MAKDWSDYFAESFNKAFSPDTAMTLAYKKWEEKNKLSPQYMASQALPYVAAMGGNLDKLTELAKYNTVEDYIKSQQSKSPSPQPTDKDFKKQVFSQWQIPEKEQYRYNVEPKTQVVKGVPTQTFVPKLKSDTEMRAALTRQKFSSTIGRLNDLFETIPSAEGIKGRMSGFNEWVKGLVGSNPKLTTYKDFKNVVVGQVAQIIGGESGARLSDQDINRMMKAFPDEWSTTSERREKQKIFQETVDDIASGYGAEPLFAGITQGQVDRITVVSPDGKVGTIPSSQLESAIKSGYKRK
jgi:hypothetical protein